MPFCKEIKINNESYYFFNFDKELNSLFKVICIVFSMHSVARS